MEENTNGNEEILYEDYIEDAFTKDGDDVNLDVDHINAKCFLSKTNKFSLDEDGNLIVNSIAFTGSQSNNGIFDLVYPVGSIYMSVNNVSPSNLFGGTWEQITNRFLLGAGVSYTLNSTGGSTSVTSVASSGSTGAPSTDSTGSTTLTLAQIPSHQHNIQGHNSTGSTVTWTDKAVTYASDNKGYNTGIRTNYQGGGQGHTHTLNNHTHSLNSHTHSVNIMPPYLAVNIWKRTA